MSLLRTVANRFATAGWAGKVKSACRRTGGDSRRIPLPTAQSGSRRSSAQRAYLGTGGRHRLPGLSLQCMYELALQVPQFAQAGIGVYDGGFLHVDVREHRARWARVSGRYVGIAALVREPELLAEGEAVERCQPRVGADAPSAQRSEARHLQIVSQQP